MDPNYLSVSIKNRDGAVFEGECRSVSSRNKLGKFDILARHANFITLVEDEVALVLKNGEKLSIPVDNGVAKVKENKVEIFLGVQQAFQKS